jgi:hypothetical protein
VGVGEMDEEMFLPLIWQIIGKVWFWEPAMLQKVPSMLGEVRVRDNILTSKYFIKSFDDFSW